MPLPAIWTLQISRTRKLGLSCLFLTGSIALAAACVRYAVFLNYDARNVMPSSSAPLIIVTIIEPGMYLIVACLPAMYPLLSALTPDWVRERVNSGISAARKHAKEQHPGKRSTTMKLMHGGQAASFARLVDQETMRTKGMAEPVKQERSATPRVADG